MADPKTIAISLGRFTLTINRREQHFLLILLFIAVVTGCFIWFKRHRWDDPWLAADDRYLVIAVKFDGIPYEDKRFKPLRDAVLGTQLDGFQPDDYFEDNAPWPHRYSWVRIYCHTHAPETLKADTSAYKNKLSASILKTGINVKWSIATITRDGDIILPE